MSDAAAALPGTRTPIKDLPKVSLHDHLDGGLRPQTIIELADAIGIEVPETDAAALATGSPSRPTPARSSST